MSACSSRPCGPDPWIPSVPSSQTPPGLQHLTSLALPGVWRGTTSSPIVKMSQRNPRELKPFARDLCSAPGGLGMSWAELNPPPACHEQVPGGFEELPAWLLIELHSKQGPPGLVRPVWSSCSTSRLPVPCPKLALYPSVWTSTVIYPPVPRAWGHKGLEHTLGYAAV